MRELPHVNVHGALAPDIASARHHRERLAMPFLGNDVMLQLAQGVGHFHEGDCLAHDIAELRVKLEHLQPGLERAAGVPALGVGLGHEIEGGALAPEIAHRFEEREHLLPDEERAGEVAPLGQSAALLAKSLGLLPGVGGCGAGTHAVFPLLVRARDARYTAHERKGGSVGLDPVA